MARQTAFLSLTGRKRSIFLALGLSTMLILVIIFSQDETRILYQNIAVAAASTAAFAFSAYISYISSPVYRRTFVMLTVGLGLWAAGELTWSVYVQVLNIDVPFPSVADLFYLGGYVFVGLFLLRIVQRLVSANKRNVLVISTVSVSIVASILNVFILEIVRESFTVTSLPLDRVITLVLGITYPILDGLLLIPSMILLYESRRVRNEYFSWIMISIAMLLLGIGDAGFGYAAIRNIEVLADEAIWDIIYGIAYIFIIGALFNEITVLRKQSKFPINAA